ncbi:MAG: hypothetical protein COV31_01785 [Candidatus Yanofskybacteria bacterium CG10_big_fil_rev_8_21_14_0_10_46_23]|uniref:Uncharacterized protein n=1 Tax=Candidatus Yanofskybacteria bacterium CG10_big_fil_rev_8_21_14_0_10_46_23 TaxID=1975098 RepID=A0A2H0R475_9BACT|nr:MAG: hypothetical protein COV31_01785 [Candidatus Yanofskybacteria bacterium CG10_big_fil_rev_8_21_14_0_10_46_23]
MKGAVDIGLLPMGSRDPVSEDALMLTIETGLTTLAPTAVLVGADPTSSRSVSSLDMGTVNVLWAHGTPLLQEPYAYYQYKH